ncbi:MAG: SGNH/GDSL hydrolase family protein [Beijerinckiaceae bacterium]
MSKTFGTALALITSLFVSQSASAEPLNDSTCRSARLAAYDGTTAMKAARMTIVAVGSSSTEGISRNAKNKLYPAAMKTSLAKLWPTAEITMINKGKGGETMQQTIQRFETDVLALKPSLVIWQLGVNDVLRFNGLDGRREEIQSGLRTLTNQGIPVILLDLQYAPVVLHDPDALPMQDLIGEEAKKGPRGRVFHFKRFAAMKQLAEKHQVPMSEMTDGDGLHMTDEMHSCVGTLLAEMVAGAETQTARATP